MASSESTEWLNYIRFLLEKSSKGAKEASSPIHESFRLWIVCSSLSSYLSLASLSVPSNCVAVNELQKVRIWITALSHLACIFANSTLTLTSPQRRLFVCPIIGYVDLFTF